MNASSRLDGLPEVSPLWIENVERHKKMAKSVKANGAHTERKQKDRPAFSKNLVILMAKRGGMNAKQLSDELAATGFEITEDRIGELRTRGPKELLTAQKTDELVAIADFFGVELESMFVDPMTGKSTNGDDMAELLRMAKEALAGPKKAYLAESIQFCYAQAKTAKNWL